MALRYLPTALGAAVLLSLGASTAHAADNQPTVIRAVRHDISAPMREILKTMPEQIARGTEAEPDFGANILLKPVNRHSTLVPDYAATQRQATGVPAPLPNLSFDGINVTTSGCGCMPPDTNGDVSDQHYIQWVNSAWQIFDKATGLPNPATLSPKPGNSFFASMGGKCASTNSGDPLALWDPKAQRWVMSQFVTTAPYAQCVAVSTTSDPLGSYYRYEFNWPNFGDYPKMGVWTDESGSQNAYLLITHEFGGTPQTFMGAALIAMERDKMLVGDPSAAMVRFGGYDAYGVQPVNLTGLKSAPANACPSYVHFDMQTSEYLFWDLCLYWATPASSTITADANATRIAGQPFSPYFDSVPQKGTTNGLDSFGSNMMYRANARAFPADAPTRVSLVVNHTVQGATQQASVNWIHFDLDDHGVAHASPTPLDKKIAEEGVYAPDGKNRWMGGIAIDGSGNIGIGYSKSDATINPQINISGRTLDDATGTMRDEQICTPTTTGSQTGTSNRWGDYSSMSVDPVDQCTFYFTSEYYATNAPSSWRTRVCSFKFPDCGSPTYAVVAETPKRVEMCGATNTTDPSYGLRAGVLSGFNGSVALVANNVPGGATAQFSSNPIASPGASTLTLVGGAALPSGEYSFSVDGNSGAMTRNVALELGISANAPNGVQLVKPLDTTAGVKVHPLLTWGPTTVAITDRVFGDGFDGTPLPPSVTPATDALSYTVQVATDAAFANIVASATVKTTQWAVDATLNTTSQYYWRVIPHNHCGDGPTSATFSFSTGVPGQCPAGTTSTTLFQDDMESGINGWTTDGTGGTAWAQMAAPANTGLSTKVWGVKNNTVTSDRGLISPVFTIPAASQAAFVSFDTYHRFEDNGPGSCWDNGTMQIKAGTGAFSYLDGSRLFTDPYDGIASAGEANAGSASWCQAPAIVPPTSPNHSIVDLDGFEGQAVMLRWRAVSDSNTAAPAPNGMYVDNVKVEVCQ